MSGGETPSQFGGGRTGTAGLRARVRRVEGAALAAVRVVFPGGADRESMPGQALLAGRMLAEGTVRRRWDEIAAETEARGAILSSFGGYESHGLAIDALAEDVDEALAWAAELAFESAFPVDRFDWLRRQAAAELEALADEADAFTARAHLDQIWAPHPRARALQGDAASLARLGSDDARAFHEAALAGPIVVTVAGLVDEAEVLAALKRRFGTGSAPTNSDGRPEPDAPAPDPGIARREIRTRARDQAHLFLGHRTVSRSHPDFAALELAGVLLGAGSGLTGRIPQRIRESEGLAYTATADAVTAASRDDGRLSIYVGTSPATVAQAEASARDELARFLAEPIPRRDFEDARSFLLGREPFRRETGRQWADLLASAELLGLPLDDPDWHVARLRELDVAAVEAAARRHLAPEKLRVTVGLPEGA